MSSVALKNIKRCFLCYNFDLSHYLLRQFLSSFTTNRSDMVYFILTQVTHIFLWIQYYKDQKYTFILPHLDFCISYMLGIHWFL